MTHGPFPVLTHLAPVLIVEQVEPSLAFWVDRFGFEVRNEAPWHDGSLFFASVVKGEIEIMYQTRASLGEGAPTTSAGLSGCLYFTVPDLDAVERAVAGTPVVKPRHQTPYGSTEIYIREPGGMMVGFAQF